MQLTNSVSEIESAIAATHHKQAWVYFQELNTFQNWVACILTEGKLSFLEIKDKYPDSAKVEFSFKVDSIQSELAEVLADVLDQLNPTTQFHRVCLADSPLIEVEIIDASDDGYNVSGYSQKFKEQDLARLSPPLPTGINPFSISRVYRDGDLVRFTLQVSTGLLVGETFKSINLAEKIDRENSLPMLPQTNLADYFPSTRLDISELSVPYDPIWDMLDEWIADENSPFSKII